jgi:hypothetical protein
MSVSNRPAGDINFNIMPRMPVITPGTRTLDSVRPVITAPIPGVLVGPLPAITGTAAPGASVSVSLDGRPSVAVRTGMDGKWSMPLVSPPPPGSHTVSAQVGTQSATTTFMVLSGSETPSVVTITSPNSGALTGLLREIAGTAPALAEVSISLDGGAPTTVRASTDGRWKLAVREQPPVGSHSVVATSRGISTNVGFVVTENQTLPVQPETPSENTPVREESRSSSMVPTIAVGVGVFALLWFLLNSGKSTSAVARRNPASDADNLIALLVQLEAEGHVAFLAPSGLNSPAVLTIIREGSDRFLVVGREGRKHASLADIVPLMHAMLSGGWRWLRPTARR